MKLLKVSAALFILFSLTYCTQKGEGVSTEGQSADTIYAEQEIHDVRDSNRLAWSIKEVDSIFMNLKSGRDFKKSIHHHFEASPRNCSDVVNGEYADGMCYRFSWDTVDQSLGHLLHPRRAIAYLYTLRRKSNNPNINLFDDPTEIPVGFGGSFPIAALNFPIVGLDSASVFSLFGETFRRETSKRQARHFAIEMSDLYVFGRRAYELKVSIVNGKVNYFEFLKNDCEDPGIREKLEYISSLKEN